MDFKTLTLKTLYSSYIWAEIKGPLTHILFWFCICFYSANEQWAHGLRTWSQKYLLPMQKTSLICRPVSDCLLLAKECKWFHQTGPVQKYVLKAHKFFFSFLKRVLFALKGVLFLLRHYEHMGFTALNQRWHLFFMLNDCRTTCRMQTKPFLNKLTKIKSRLAGSAVDSFRLDVIHPIPGLQRF